MAQYRKKPIVIDAFKISSDAGSWPKWFTDELGKSVRGSGGIPVFFIKTLEGEMRADPEDWIIRGVKGEFYPIKDDIFRATYDPI